MSARGIGAICGVIIGLILCVVIFKICNKDKKIKSEYDERQETIRGRGYKYSFYTALGWMAFMAVWPLTDIQLLVDDTVLSFSGIMISVSVIAVYSIWNDAYWGINNNKGRYLVVFALATVINLLVGIMSIIHGGMIVDGVVQAPAVNLLCGVLFLIIACTIVLKKSVKDKEEEM